MCIGSTKHGCNLKSLLIDDQTNGKKTAQRLNDLRFSARCIRIRLQLKQQLPYFAKYATMECNEY